MRLRPSAAAFAVVALAAAVSGATAQEVRFTPRPDAPEERQLERFLERGDYRILVVDTVFAPSDTIREDLLVLDATVRSSARIEGGVHVVGGDLFLRPGAVVTGEVVALGGGLYRSERATVEGEVVYRPNLLLRVVPMEGGWEILHPREERSPLVLDGLYGFHLPTYQRVDGVTLGWGATARAAALPAQPQLSVDARFHTVGARQGEGTVELALHPTGGTRVGVLAERRTRSMDDWIRGDVANSLSYLLGLDDFRNYYQADRVRLELASTRRRGWAPAIWVGREDADSLTARPLTVLFGNDDDVRRNPGVDDGAAWAAGAEVTYRRRTAESRLVGRIAAEAADSTVGGDFSYLMGEVSLAYEGPGVGSHTVEAYGIGRFDVAGTLPRQRWSALGGTGTLPVLETLELRGPRLLFASATYLVPIEPLGAPVVGAPKLFVRNAAGTAWREDGTFRLEDNVAVGVRYLFLELAAAVDVTRSDLDADFVLGASFPGRFWD